MDSGLSFFSSIFSLCVSSNDPEWNTFNPMTHASKIWNERALPKIDPANIDLKPSKNLFNLFSGVNKSNQSVTPQPSVPSDKNNIYYLPGLLIKFVDQDLCNVLICISTLFYKHISFQLHYHLKEN